MDILLLVFVFIFGFIFGWFRANKTMLDKLLANPEDMITLLKKYKEVKDEVEETNGEVREIEVHKGMFFLYAKDNGQFLGQGKTIDEALDSVRKRFPGQNFHGHIPAKEAQSMGLSKQT